MDDNPTTLQVLFTVFFPLFSSIGAIALMLLFVRFIVDGVQPDPLKRRHLAERPELPPLPPGVAPYTYDAAGRIHPALRVAIPELPQQLVPEEAETRDALERRRAAMERLKRLPQYDLGGKAKPQPAPRRVD